MAKDRDVVVVDKTTPYVHEIDEQPLWQLADKYYRLQNKVSELLKDPSFEEMYQTEKELKERLKRNFKPTDSIEIRGLWAVLVIGPQAKASREIKSMLTVFKLLGQKMFLKLARVNIGDLEKYLTPEELDKVLVDTGKYTERRDIKIIEKRRTK